MSKTTATYSTCAILASLLPSQVSFPGDAAYNSSESSYCYVQEQIKDPSCIVQPSSITDVSSVVDILQSSSTKFDIRSGGHASNSGFSNINDGGLTLDLTSMNSVDFLEDCVTSSVGTGASWAEVYPVLDAHSRFVNGGRASGVGVGGFLSGGYITFHSPVSSNS